MFSNSQQRTGANVEGGGGDGTSFSTEYLISTLRERKLKEESGMVWFMASNLPSNTNVQQLRGTVTESVRRSCPRTSCYRRVQRWKRFRNG